MVYDTVNSVDTLCVNYLCDCSMQLCGKALVSITNMICYSYKSPPVFFPSIHVSIHLLTLSHLTHFVLAGTYFQITCLMWVLWVNIDNNNMNV